MFPLLKPSVYWLRNWEVWNTIQYNKIKLIYEYIKYLRKVTYMCVDSHRESEADGED